MLIIREYIEQAFLTSEAVNLRFLVRNVLLKISQNSQENQKLFFFNFGNLSFWQIIRILVSSDPAPFFLADLFLYYYENKWLLDTKKIDLQKARLFINLFTDDLCAINVHLEFDKNYRVIYPSGLELNKENRKTFEASFLDLSVIIEKKKV